MAERGFQTELWTDPFIQELSPEAKLLFIYLWTNKHCNQAGLYEITLKTMSFDTGLPQESLAALLKQLEPKVAWYPEQNLIWVKNFLKRQCKSQSFLIAAAKNLKTIRDNGLFKEFIKFNESFDLMPLCEHSGGTVLPQSPHSGNTVHTPVPVPGPGKGGRCGEEATTPVTKTASRDKNMRTFGEALNIKLTPEEYAKLVERLGEQGAKWWIDELSLAKASKGYKSKSDYFTILAWERRRQKGGTDDQSRRERTDAHRKDPLQAFRDAGGTVILSGEDAEAGNEDGAV